MLKIKYIAVHMFNDFSGSPRVLADFCALNCIPSEDLTIITSNTPGFLGKSLGRLRLTRYRRSNSTLLNRLMFFLAQCQTFFIVISLCIKSRRAGERVVIINNTIFCLASMIAGWLMGAFTIVYIHELYSRSSIIKKMLERLVNLMSDKTFIVSQLLMKSYRLDPQKTFLLPNGLRADFDMQNELDPQAKFSHGTVLFVGSLKQYKGVEEFVKIAREIPQAEFYASLNCDSEDLKNFFANVDLPRNLILRARDCNLRQLYQDAFLLLNLSLPPNCIEGFGLTILEGMSAGCPCVVPKSGGHMDYFTEGAGFISDGRDVMSIATFIQELRTDYDRWRRFSDQAIKISRQYSAEVYRKKADEFMAAIVLDCKERHDQERYL